MYDLILILVLSSGIEVVLFIIYVVKKYFKLFTAYN